MCQRWAATSEFQMRAILFSFQAHVVAHSGILASPYTEEFASRPLQYLY
jgi:hypothetical protein